MAENTTTPMSKLVVGGKTYESVDAAAREDIGEIQNDLSSLENNVTTLQAHQVQTTTQTDTSSAQGVIRLSNVPDNATILTISVSSGGTNYYGMPFKYDNRVWYAHVMDWQTFKPVGNAAVTFKIWYIPE